MYLKQPNTFCSAENAKLIRVLVLKRERKKKVVLEFIATANLNSLWGLPFERDSLGLFKASLKGEVIGAGLPSEQQDPGQSGGLGVNGVSDGLLVSKGLLLLLYTDMTTQLVSSNWHVLREHAC